LLAAKGAAGSRDRDRWFQRSCMADENSND
jgi:hypothetical protein